MAIIKRGSSVQQAWRLGKRLGNKSELKLNTISHFAFLAFYGAVDQQQQTPAKVNTLKAKCRNTNNKSNRSKQKQRIRRIRG